MSITNTQWPSENGLHVGALNVCDISNEGKLENISALLDNNGNHVHIMGISESRCSTEEHVKRCNIKNYDIEASLSVSYTNDRINRVGVLVYIHNSVTYKRCKDLEHPEIECIWLKVNYHNTPFLVGQIYRNCTYDSDWFMHFESMMDKVSSLNIQIVLLGDININTLDKGRPAYKQWSLVHLSYNLNQLIDVPTRVTKDSATIIDHIYTDNSNNISELCVPTCGISDHYPIFCTLKSSSNKSSSQSREKNEHKYILYRSFKHFSKDAFISDIINAPFDVVYNYTEPNEALDIWSRIFMKIINVHAPLKKKRVKSDTMPPWLTSTIRQEMKARDMLKSNNKYDEYKKQRNKVKSLIRTAKKEYINSLIKDKADSRNIWKAIKLLRNSKSDVGDLKLEPDVFNNHFTSVAEKLIKNNNNITSSNDNFDSVLKKIDTFFAPKLKHTETLVIPFISAYDVSSYLKSLKQNTSAGLDGIHNRFLKIAYPFITDSLTYIYNLMIAQNIVPHTLKAAKCVPLFKGGSKDDPSNYRPISILSSLVKPLEKHIQTHVMAFFEKHNLFHSSQSAFRKNHSCETAILNLTEKMYASCNNGKLTAAVFIDFSKAFDLINHSKLLDKLEHYGISPVSIPLFASYLNDRTQTVCISNKQSTSLRLDHGIPQGSILGPLLFSIYINDLPLHISDTDCDLFADDTTLTKTSSSLKNLQCSLNKSLKQLSRWCALNDMIVNPIKSESMLICTFQKRIRLNSDELNLTFNNTAIPQVKAHTLLGVTLDQNLQWTEHTQNVSKKIASQIFQLNCIKDFLDEHTRKMFYFAYIQPHFDYCSSVWSHCARSHLKRIFSLQRKAIRTIVSISNEDHVDLADIFIKLDILTFDKLIAYRDVSLVKRVLDGTAPINIQNMFIKQEARYFENDLRFRLPKADTDMLKMSFSYQGTLSWNQLPLRIRIIDGIGLFRKELKSFLISS